MNWFFIIVFFGMTYSVLLVEEVISSENIASSKLEMIESIFKRSFEKASYSESLDGERTRSKANRDNGKSQDVLSYLQHGFHPPNAETWKLQCVWKAMKTVARNLPQILSSNIEPRTMTEMRNLCERLASEHCGVDFDELHCDSNQEYRSINGTCNNLNYTRWGSAVQPFERFLPADYGEIADGDSLSGPFDHIWHTDQCEHIKYHHDITTILDCKHRCSQKENCNAFNYNEHKQGCRLMACPVCIPAPLSSNKYEGYALNPGYEIYPAKMIDSRCKKLEWYRTQETEACIVECRRNTKCNAFHYKNNHGGCALMSCPYPIPEPVKEDTQYDAYTLNKGYEIYPKKMIDSRCKKLEWYRTEKTEACILECSRNTKCNAFHYKINHGGCALMSCPYPIPEPVKEDTRYDSYIVNEGSWSGPFDNVWNDDQCGYIGVWGGDGGLSLSGCQALCLRKPNCTAVNWNSNITRCEPRICPFPVPAPNWKRGYFGYSLSSGGPSLRRSKKNIELPNPRKISRALSNSEPREQPKVSLMLMQWGQFLDHDITLTPERELEEKVNGSKAIMCCNEGQLKNSVSLLDDCVPIDVTDDSYYQRGDRQCIRFIRSMPVARGCAHTPMEQINRITAFVDGSMVYGSDMEVADSLRTKIRGLLNTTTHKGNGQPLPPRGSPSDDGPHKCPQAESMNRCFLAGDVRVDEIPGLTALHTTFIRLHNIIAKELAKLNTTWKHDDEKIYQETRRIVIALIQQTTYRDWLPHVVGPTLMEEYHLETGRHGYRDSYNPDVNPTIRNVFATAAFRFGHSLIDERVKAAIPDMDQSVKGRFFDTSTIESNGTSPSSLLKGLTRCPAQPIDPVVEEAFTNSLFAEKTAVDGKVYGLDLVSLNIQRGRDHGIPSYREWRKFCGLEDIKEFGDLKKVMPEDIAETFNHIYHDIDDIDLFPAGLAENSIGDGILGPTFSCIIARQFANTKHGDRFWYERENQPKQFTPEQLSSIRTQGLASILCKVSEHTTFKFQPDPFLVADEYGNKVMSCTSYNFINLQPWEEH